MRHFILLCALGVGGGLVSPSRAALLEIAGGYSQVSADWQDDLWGHNDHLSTEYETTSFSRIEGSLGEKKFGLSAGFNAEVDNNEVGKVNRISGQLGFKRLYLRVSRGGLKGRAIYDGAIAPWQERDIEFENEFNHVDLIYWFRGSDKMPIPFYIGAGYTRLAMPVEMRTTTTPGGKKNQVLGTPVFDPDYRGQFYEFLFGFDTFASSMLQEDSFDAVMKKQMKGFGIFFNSEDRVGLGQVRVGEDAVAAASWLNGDRYPKDHKLFSAYLEFNVNAGLSWTGRLGPARFSVGAGYELMLATVTSFEGGVSSPDQVGLDPNAELMRHGPILRAYARW